MAAEPAIGESITGVPWEELQASSPKVANLIDMQVRYGEASMFILSLLSLAITIYAFRPGQRWAWYTLWILPLWNVAIFLTTFVAERQPGFPPPRRISRRRSSSPSPSLRCFCPTASSSSRLETHTIV